MHGSTKNPKKWHYVWPPWKWCFFRTLLQACSSLLLGLLYTWSFGPPGPALARARPGPLLAVPCLARPNIKSGRAVPGHGLYQQPKHGPAGLFRAGSARWSPALQPRPGCPKPIVQNTSHPTPNLTSNSKKRSQFTASHTQRHIAKYHLTGK